MKETVTGSCSFSRMARNGRTIILSIHQPRYSIYRLFDSLTLLVQGKQVSHAVAASGVFASQEATDPVSVCRFTTAQPSPPWSTSPTSVGTRA